LDPGKLTKKKNSLLEQLSMGMAAAYKMVGAKNHIFERVRIRKRFSGEKPLPRRWETRKTGLEISTWTKKKAKG